MRHASIVVVSLLAALSAAACKDKEAPAT
ncbi:MAG: hypothetical protein JWP97_6121, partial [Labilithrix sp.]|nr:hypothetical protein [Labilithrix sp.]